MRKRAKAIFFIIGLLIFILLIHQFGLNNILINIEKTGWWILAIFGIWIVVYLLNAFAWRFILKPIRNKISFGEIFSVSLSGFAINYITPVVNLGGEPYKIFALKDQLGTSDAVSYVLLYSMLHFLSSFLFWIIAILLALFSLTLSPEMKIFFVSGFIISLLGVWFFYSRYRNGIFGILIKFIPRLPFIKKLSESLKLKKESLEDIDEKIISLYTERKSDFYFSLLLEVAARFVISIEFIFILHAIGLNLSFEYAIYINAFSSFFMNMIFFMPFELGVREGSLYFIMNVLKFSSGIGIYIGLITRIRELFWILIGLILIQFRKTKQVKETSRLSGLNEK